jgi:hypothetical protein
VCVDTLIYHGPIMQLCAKNLWTQKQHTDHLVALFNARGGGAKQPARSPSVGARGSPASSPYGRSPSVGTRAAGSHDAAASRLAPGLGSASVAARSTDAGASPSGSPHGRSPTVGARGAGSHDAAASRLAPGLGSASVAARSTDAGASPAAAAAAAADMRSSEDVVRGVAPSRKVRGRMSITDRVPGCRCRLAWSVP